MSGILQKGARRFTTQIGPSGVPDAVTTTIPLVSVTGLPVDTQIEIVVDRTDSSGNLTPAKEEVIRGTVSGLNLINCIRGVEGTAQAHSAAATVNSFLTASMWNNVIEYIRDLPNQGLINGKIAPSVSSNNLTLAIKTLNDADPSVSNPVYIWIGGVLRSITSAITFTVNAGTNYLNLGSSELATRAQDLFAYCQWNSTTNAVNIIASRIPIGRRMNDFVNSATNEKGAIGIVNYNATDNVVNVGRFEVTLSASASFNWSVPTYTNDTLVQHPIERTRRRTLLPTYSADGSMTWTSITTNLAEYQIIGRQIIYYISAGGTTGGTASASLRTTYPMAPFNTSNNIRGAASVRDAGNSLAGYYFLGAQANFAKPDGTNYGIGINREVYATIIYDIL